MAGIWFGRPVLWIALLGVLLYKNTLDSRNKSTHYSGKEITKAVKNLKINKSCGDDHIIDEYIKSTYQLFISVHEKLFNIIFDHGIIPDIWLVWYIKPLYKTKAIHLIQPITVQSPFLVVLENYLQQYWKNFEKILRRILFCIRKPMWIQKMLFNNE